MKSGEGGRTDRHSFTSHQSSALYPLSVTKL
jgi:hypothetical protein